MAFDLLRQFFSCGMKVIPTKTVFCNLFGGIVVEFATGLSVLDIAVLIFGESCDISVTLWERQLKLIVFSRNG